MDSTQTSPGTDSSGFRYFSEGTAGEAHELAHKLLDEGREREGFERLGAWLSRDGLSRHGSSLNGLDRPAGPALDSRWVHLHWHMAVFEIAVGRLDEAYSRYRERILPAVHRGEALTDAPSLLWRLYLAGGESFPIDWQPVCEAAVRHLGHDDPYVEMHNLLALAGAREVHRIDRWLDRHYRGDATTGLRVSLQLAWALRTFANRDYETSATLLRSLRELSRLGGSRAQNTLWGDIAHEATARQRRTPGGAAA